MMIVWRLAAMVPAATVTAGLISAAVRWCVRRFRRVECRLIFVAIKSRVAIARPALGVQGRAGQGRAGQACYTDMPVSDAYNTRLSISAMVLGARAERATVGAKIGRF